MLPRGGVVFREGAHDTFEMQRSLSGSKGAGNKHPRTVADEAAHGRHPMNRQAVKRERAVERSRNAGQRLHQCTVQIKNESALHGAEGNTGSPR